MLMLSQSGSQRCLKSTDIRPTLAFRTIFFLGQKSRLAQSRKTGDICSVHTLFSSQKMKEKSSLELPIRGLSSTYNFDGVLFT